MLDGVARRPRVETEFCLLSCYTFGWLFISMCVCASVCVYVWSALQIMLRTLVEHTKAIRRRRL